MHRFLKGCAAAIIAVTVAYHGGAAKADPDAGLPGKVSKELTDQLARTDLDAVADITAKYMGGTVADRLKNSFASIKDLGKSQYDDLIYSRDYGQTEKDIIYKIDFAKAFVFVRFLWHLDNGNWRLIHINFKTENDLPFPAGWEHIYPK